MIPWSKLEKFREILRFVHIKDVDDKVMAEVRRIEMNFDQAIAANAFTIIGQGSVDFPAFFAFWRKQLFRMDGRGTGRDLWRDHRASGGERSGESQISAAGRDDEVRPGERPAFVRERDGYLEKFCT